MYLAFCETICELKSINITKRTYGVGKLKYHERVFSPKKIPTENRVDGLQFASD